MIQVAKDAATAVFAGFARPLALVILAAVAPPLAATQSDVAKEQRWAEQVIDGLLDGDEVWLDDGEGHEFLGILTEGDGEGDHAVILVHGIGVHPNWPDVIYPLREALLEHGTTSLSIQMPILANDADEVAYAPLFAEVPARLQAAIDYLGDAGYDDISLVGHSMGASMVAHYLARDADPRVASAALIGMGPGYAFASNIEKLRQIDLPVLDLYGSEDLEAVVASARDRATAGGARAGDAYRQLRVDGANHFFQGHEAVLKQQIIDWLDGLE